MMARPEPTLGELELEVLKLVWQEQPCTVPHVADIMARRRGYARTTVLTVIQRLHAKGFLKRRKTAGGFHYSTTSEHSKIMSGLIGRFVEKVLDGSTAPFIAYLTESEGLSAQQVKTLKQIARKLDGTSRKA